MIPLKDQVKEESRIQDLVLHPNQDQALKHSQDPALVHSQDVVLELSQGLTLEKVPLALILVVHLTPGL